VSRNHRRRSRRRNTSSTRPENDVSSHLAKVGTVEPAEGPAPDGFAMTELTAADIKSLLAKFSYRPNFEFTVIEDHKLIPDDLATPGDLAIHVKMYTLNARTYPPNLDYVEITNFPSPIPETVLKGGEKVFWRYLHDDVIGELEHHEMDEWFKVHSKPLRDPHSPLTQEEWAAKQKRDALIFNLIPFALTRKQFEDASLPMPEELRQTLHNIRQVLYEENGLSWYEIDKIPGLQPVAAMPGTEGGE
jgi:hypothetical protein